MAATVKHRRSKTRQRKVRGARHYKITELPQLVVLESGKRVPRHMVTPDNPTKNGVKFLRTKKSKKLAAAA